MGCGTHSLPKINDLHSPASAFSYERIIARIAANSLSYPIPTCSETPVVEKEVEECDAPKVAETEEAAATTETTTTNGSSEAVTENGTETDAAAPTPAEEEAVSEEVTEAPAAETNGDSTGKNSGLELCVAV